MKVLELFAGCGGLALGLEEAGFEHLALYEKDKNCVKTIKKNRPEWNIIQADVSNIDFTPYRDKVDIVCG
jgi:DNA (cytosine-5)-methyltransferase 1